MILHTQHCSPVSIRTREDEVREAGYAYLREREANKKEWFCNYDTMDEATHRASLMNDLAEQTRQQVDTRPAWLRRSELRDNGVMNVALYRYSAGAPYVAHGKPEMASMGGLYRERISNQ